MIAIIKITGKRKNPKIVKNIIDDENKYKLWHISPWPPKTLDETAAL